MAFPAEERIGDVSRALASGRDVVFTAPPGSGKTTCLPPALIGAPWLKGRKIVMLEPRRIAARRCAEYIAEKIGCELGGKVDYQVRLERKTSRDTKLEIITEGLLTQRLLSDPELSDTGLVIFDEFHERSLNSDLAFALALEMKRALRPDLRILVMSATIDAEEVNLRLQGEVIRADGRMFPVETRYLGDISPVAAVRKALAETEGDILAFLPGEGEIRRCRESLEGERGIDCLPLYGALPKEDQDRVFEPSPRRKVILATSIAETSLTVPGIKCVIDSGLMRVQRFSPSTGMSGLVTLPVTLDRAEQRSGRAGRVCEGVAYRLWTQADERSRSAKALPEILDADLAPLVLCCASWGAKGRCDLPWLTEPPSAAWEQAKSLLVGLGAVDANGALTDRGRRMAEMPMHPRLANMMMSGSPRAAELAAIIEESQQSRETDIRYARPDSRTRRLAAMFSRFCRPQGAALSDGALLSLAYPDRIAKNRGNGTFRMVCGRGAFLPENDPLAGEEFLVCCRLDDRQGDARVFLACPVALSEIEALFGDRMVEERLCEWDRRGERVKSVVRRRLGEMAVDERACADADTTPAMMEGIRVKGVENLPCWTPHSLGMRSRIDFLWHSADDAALMGAIEPFVSGMTKWKDLERLDLSAVFDYLLSTQGHTRGELDALAPERIAVPSGSHVRIDYTGAEPVAEAKLQECFGMMETPKVAGGSVPVVMTLLSPAMRPCAVTKDLAGFWREGYQLVKKDLKGRYPKHYWPDDPFTAVATRRVRPK